MVVFDKSCTLLAVEYVMQGEIFKDPASRNLFMKLDECSGDEIGCVDVYSGRTCNFAKDYYVHPMNARLIVEGVRAECLRFISRLKIMSLSRRYLAERISADQKS